MIKKDLALDFKSRINPIDFTEIFEELDNVYLFAKNTDSRFVMGNKAAVQAFGFNSLKDFIGKSDYDLTSTEIANQYRQDDQQVFLTASPLKNIIEPLPGKKGKLRWFSTSKYPLRDHSNTVIGVAVIMKEISKAGFSLGPFQEISEILEFIFKNYQRQILVEELAELKSISVKKLERRFKKIFGQTPLKYINEHRIKIACIKLRESKLSISEIALNCGFYDHAHFIRNFKKTMRMTPRSYRSQFK